MPRASRRNSQTGCYAPPPARRLDAERRAALASSPHNPEVEEDSMAQATLPPWIHALQQRDPEFVSSYMAQRERILRDGAIPAKYKILMTMIVDALLSHPDGVANIAGRARRRRVGCRDPGSGRGGLPLRRHACAGHCDERVSHLAQRAGVATKIRCEARSSVWARISRPASARSQRQSSTVYLFCTGKSRKARLSASGPLSFMTSRR